MRVDLTTDMRHVIKKMREVSEDIADGYHIIMTDTLSYEKYHVNVGDVICQLDEILYNNSYLPTKLVSLLTNNSGMLCIVSEGELLRQLQALVLEKYFKDNQIL